MDQFHVGHFPHSAENLLGRKAADAFGVGTRVVGQTPSELDAVAVANGNDVALAKRPGNGEHADRQQASAAALDGLSGAVVEPQ